ncbi:MAG: hypothetical protein PUP93_25450 [Rhizonema sp. NSF051]|nr:hypothetical protein [Rhizonema sp. NSF051]
MSLSARHALLPSTYQQQNLEAMLGLFLEAQGHPLPEHCKTRVCQCLKPISIGFMIGQHSRVIRTTRNRVIQEILSERPLGRKPFLQVIIDLTTLEKFGKFKAFQNLIRVYNGKRGLHACCGVESVVGREGVPWNFRVWRGKGTASPAQLGLKMVKSLPKKLTKHFQVMVLVDTGFDRWLVLSLISYVLAHWAYLSTAIALDELPDWGNAAKIAFQTIFPHLIVLLLLQDIEHLRELALSQGINIRSFQVQDIR